ncbi:MAG: prolipoprotein diacylglyceryl transferase family protein [Planctomycetota bacterium]
MDNGRIGYFIAMVVATIAAGLLYRRDNRSTLSTEQRLGIAIGGVVGATFFAKLPFLFSSGSPAAFWFGDGKTVLWGLAGGYLGVEVAKWSLYVRCRTGDRFVVPVAVAIGLGRFGCLFNGCCYGVPTDGSWGFSSAVFASDTVARHPAPLYESVFHLAFAAAAAIGTRRGLCRDLWMLIYLVSYCVFRFVSETWRCEPELAYGLTFYQYSSIVIGFIFSLLLIRRTPSALPGTD